MFARNTKGVFIALKSPTLILPKASRQISSHGTEKKYKAYFGLFFFKKSSSNFISFPHSRSCTDPELSQNGADISSTAECSVSLSDTSRKRSWPRKFVTQIHSGDNPSVHIFGFALQSKTSEHFAKGEIFWCTLRMDNVYLHAENGEWRLNGQKFTS